MRTYFDLMNASYIANYIDLVRPTSILDSGLVTIFPNRPIMGLDYSYAKTTHGHVEIAPVSAYDAEPITQNRESFDAVKGDLPLFRSKMILSEKEKAQLVSTMNSPISKDYLNKLVASIYDDRMSLVTSLAWTQEYLRAKTLSEGKITMQSQGGAITIDYKVPANHKFTLTGTDAWTDVTAPILDQIKSWIEVVYLETGVMPSEMYLNYNTFKLMAKNDQVKAYAFPVSLALNAGTSPLVSLSDEQVMATIKAFTGLNSINVIHKKITIGGVAYDLIADNKISIVPMGQIGETLVGTSPAEYSKNYEGNDNVEVTAEGYAVASISSKDGAPYIYETQVEMVCLPSLPVSDTMVLATVA